MREKGNRDQGARGCPRRVSRPNCVADGERAPHATLAEGAIGAGSAVLFSSMGEKAKDWRSDEPSGISPPTNSW